MKPEVPSLTPSVIAEFEQFENDPRWQLGFLADMTVKEPALWQWYDSQVDGAIASLGTRHMPVVANDPVIIKDLMGMFTRFFMTGFYMGIRRFTSELNFGVGPMTPLGDPRRPKKPVVPGEPGYSEVSEVDISDFDNPNVEEIDDGT